MINSDLEINENGMYVITEKYYAIGEANGISRRVVYQRVNYYSYSIEDAITKPFQEKIYFTQAEKAIMKVNNILPTTARQRINKLGWKREEAISIPVEPKIVKRGYVFTYEEAKNELQHVIRTQTSLNTNKLKRLLEALSVDVLG